MKTETKILKAEAPSVDLLHMAATAHLLKAGAPVPVAGYVREDGTHVAAHARNVKPAKPFTEQAKWHTELAAKHEAIAARLGPEHAKHGLHVQAAALHQACSHHARRAGDTTLDDAARKAAVAAHAAAKKLLARTADALADQPRGTTTGDKLEGLLAKGQRLFLLQKKPAPTGPDLSQGPEAMIKSFAPELWVHGKGTFA